MAVFYRVARTLACSALIQVAVGSGLLGADDGEWRRVAEEAPKAVASLRAAYSQLHGSASRSESRVTGEDKKVIQTQSRLKFYLSGQSTRVDSTKISGAADAGPWERATCVTPQTSFRVDRATKGAAPAIDRLAGGLDEAMLRTLGVFRDETVDMVSGVARMLDDQKRPGFKAEGIEPEIRDGRSMLRIRYSMPIPPKNKVRRQHSILVSPDEGWILYEREHQSGPYSRKVEVVYGPPVGTTPRPSRVIHTDPFGSKTIYEFNDLVFGTPPTEVFTLAGAGVPGVDRPAADRTQGRASGWLIGSGIALFTAAVAWMVRASFKAKHTATPG